MNDQSPINTPDEFDRRATRRQRLADTSRPGTWFVGLILIMLGVAFLLQNMGMYTFSLKNWWALFILMPAFGAIDSAIRIYRHADNTLTAPAFGSLVVGMVLALVTFGFLFNINWTFFGPLLIILSGAGILAVGLFKRE